MVNTSTSVYGGPGMGQPTIYEPEEIKDVRVPPKPKASLSHHRRQLALNEDFKGRVLMLGLALCHRILNVEDAQNTKLAYLHGKAHDFINNPETFLDKLPVSVAALLPENLISARDISDEDLEPVIEDAFDGLAQLVGSKEWKKLLTVQN